MKYIRFPEAKHALHYNNEDVPFYHEANIAVMRIELSDDDIRNLKRLGGKLWIISSAPGKMVVPPVVTLDSPFAAKPVVPMIIKPGEA